MKPHVTAKAKQRNSHRRTDGLHGLWQAYAGWELALLGIGLASFIGITVILFIPVGKGPDLISPTAAVPPAGSEQFLAMVSNFMTLPVDRAPAVEMLQNGDEYLPALLRDIDSAQQTINFMAYVWKDGRFSDQLLNHLERRQQAGVQVRILLDAYGGLKAPSDRLEKFRSLGGKVSTFHSLLPLPWTVMRSTKRNHRRAIVIDGKVGYTGGFGVDDVWLGRARNPSEWHDLMFRVGGSMASRLQGSFSELWAATTGELLTGLQFYPDIPSKGLMPYIALSSSPSPDLYETETFILLSLFAARHEIEIETPYFLPNESVRKALIDKAKAGVSVTILVPNENTDEKSVRWAGQRIYEELLNAGVKIYEYQPTFTHTKLLVEDGAWSVIGSANMDIRSRRLNDEVTLGIIDTGLARSLQDVFQKDLKRSKSIELANWKRRGLLQRALEILCQAFVQQY
jgi:cardiolipin synthase